MHFYALWHWRENTKCPTFNILLKALTENEMNPCLLCEVVRDIKLKEDFAAVTRESVPDDSTLEELSHKIGNATLQLGIELGLDVIDLQNIERQQKDLIEQTREVLRKWKESLNLEESQWPVVTLSKSLKRVGKYGIVHY